EVGLIVALGATLVGALPGGRSRRPRGRRIAGGRGVGSGRNAGRLKTGIASVDAPLPRAVERAQRMHRRATAS
ncbi:MAG: hypothetical protein ACPGE9_12445, partial [Algiphilus sp.]